MAAITTQAVEHKLTGNPPLRDFRQEGRRAMAEALGGGSGFARNPLQP